MKYRDKVLTNKIMMTTLSLLLLYASGHYWHHSTPNPAETAETAETAANVIGDPTFPNGYKKTHVWVGDRTKKELQYLHRSHGQSHSKYNQDMTILKLFRGKRNGTFIDLAANQAYKLSNTFMLERDLNWSGLCVDSNYNVWSELATRKCTVVAAAVGKFMNEEIPLRFRTKAGKASIRETAYTVTLNSLFERFHLPPTIDYFSFHFEVADTYVLESFNWKNYKFNVISIEQSKASLFGETFDQQGYFYLLTLGNEAIWIHKTFLSEEAARSLADLNPESLKTI